MVDLRRSYTARQFATLVEREHERIELKSGAGRRPIQEAMVALSNTQGGAILIGVMDDRTVVGRHRDQGLDDDLHGAARDAHDTGRYRIEQVTVHDRPVVALIVDQREEGFAQTSDGRVLVRRGGHNVALLGDELEAFLATRRRRRFEDGDTAIEFDDADPRCLQRVMAAHGWSTRRKLADRLRERGLVTAGGGTLTMAGALLLTDPSASVRGPKYVVDIRGFEAPSSETYVRRETLEGPVDRQIERAVALVMRDLGTDMVVTGSTRTDLPRLPAAAVREVLANAVAHRSYELDRTPIVVEVRPDRLVVTSPGRLPEPVTVATMRDAQAPRNPHLIDVLRKLGLAEDSGRGIDLIEDRLRADFLPDPVFEETEISVIATLRTRRLITVEERAWLSEYGRTELLSEEEQLLLAHAAREGSLTNSSARAVLNVDSTQIRARLRHLCEVGVLLRRGQRGGASYELAPLATGGNDEMRVLQAARRAPLTNADVRGLLDVDRFAALRVLNRLVDGGKLIRTGDRRSAKYHSPDEP